MDACDAQPGFPHGSELLLDGGLQPAEAEPEPRGTESRDPLEDFLGRGHGHGDGDDVRLPDRLREIPLEREAVEGPRDVVHDDAVPPGPQVAAEPAAHLARPPNDEDPLVDGVGGLEALLAPHALVHKEMEESLHERLADVPRRALRKEARVHALLGLQIPEGQPHPPLLDPDLPGQVQAFRHKGDDLLVDGRDLVAQSRNLPFDQTKPPWSMRSRTPIAATFSMTGTARGTMQGSWRPVTTTSVADIVPRSTDRWGFAMDAVGFTTTRKVTGMPVEIPPRIPPARFVAVATRPPSTTNGSWCPVVRQDPGKKPGPKLLLTGPKEEENRWARTASTDS